MKGFIITAVSVSLVALLVIFSAVLHNSFLSMERVLTVPQPLTYAAFMHDDVAHDVNRIAGPHLSFNQSNSSLEITVSDTLPNQNFTGDLESYKGFLEDEVATASNTVIGINLTGLEPDNMSMRLCDNYTYSITGDEMLFTSGGGTGAQGYWVDITVPEMRLNLTQFLFNSSGDMRIMLKYTDLNGTVMEGGNLSSSEVNRFRADYPDGRRMELEIGRQAGEDGALWLRVTNVSSAFTFKATLPPIDPSARLGYEYDARMNYSQARITVDREIGK